MNAPVQEIYDALRRKSVLDDRDLLLLTTRLRPEQTRALCALHREHHPRSCICIALGLTTSCGTKVAA